MYSRVFKTVSQMMALAMVTLAPVALTAQTSAKPVAKAAADNSVSRWDIFVGYSYLDPNLAHGSVNTLQPGLPPTVIAFPFDTVNYGGISSISRYFNRHIGLQVEAGVHPNENNNNDGFETISGGLIYRFPFQHFTPFLHGLAGGVRSEGPDFQPYKWGLDLTGGGGLDWNSPWFNHRLAFRLVQADLEYAHVNHGTGVFEGVANPDMLRLSAGVVLHLGNITPPPPVTLSASAQPPAVFPGEEVTITGTAGNLNPKRKAVYTWTGNGAKGTGATAKVETATLAPGSYSVQGNVSEGKRAGESASATASFRVKAFEPPTISCSANPGTIRPGETSTITATGVSPQGRPLTYSYSAPAGSITGSGTTATFTATPGTPIDTVPVKCNVADDKGNLVSTVAAVKITAPYVPPAPKASELCTITFDKDKQRPLRVDNEAKACLDDVALSLQKQSDAKVILVGDESSKEKALAAKAAKHRSKHAPKLVEPAVQRAVNTKEYLVKDKGIDASRISVLSGSTDSKSVHNYLVPAGAKFDATGTAPVDESTVKPQVRKPLSTRKHKKKAA